MHIACSRHSLRVRAVLVYYDNYVKFISINGKLLWLNISRKQCPLKNRPVLGTSTPQYTTSCVNTCKSFGSFLSWYTAVLILQYSMLHPLKDCTKSSDRRWLRLSCWQIFFFPNDLVFQILLTLSSPFWIWKSRYKHVCSFMLLRFMLSSQFFQLCHIVYVTNATFIFIAFWFCSFCLWNTEPRHWCVVTEPSDFTDDRSTRFHTTATLQAWPVLHLSNLVQGNSSHLIMAEYDTEKVSGVINP